MYTIIRDHYGSGGGVNNLNVAKILNERFQSVKCFVTKISYEKVFGRARKYLAAETENEAIEKLLCPIGSGFSLNFGKTSLYVEKVDENTFEIHNKSGSAIVDGDHLINLITGKEEINLKFV